MSSLALLFAVSSILQIGVYSRTIKNIDIGTILEIIQPQLQLEQDRDRRTNLGNSDNYSEIENGHFVTLQSGEIVNLIKKTTNGKEKVKKYKSDKHRYDRSNGGDESNLFKIKNKPNIIGMRDQSVRNIEEILEQLFLQSSNDKKYKNKSGSEVTKQKVKPNKLLKYLNFKTSGEDILDDLNKYSNIYIILDPQAIQRSKSKKKLIDLAAQLTSHSASAEKESNENGQKGFPVRNNLLPRRSRHHSKEKYKEESMEDDFKRSWNDHAVGNSGRNEGRIVIPTID